MIEILESNCYFNRFGTRKTKVKFKGAYSVEDIKKQLVTDAPYGWWSGFKCVDEKNKIYEGEIHEYWD